MAYFGMVGDSEKSAELDELNQHRSNTELRGPALLTLKRKGCHPGTSSAFWPRWSPESTAAFGPL